MKGTVVDINQQRSMAAILTEDEEFSTLELFSDDVEVDDVLRWEGEYPLGSETITNVTQSTKFDGYFQNHCIPKNQLRQQMLYK